MAELQKQPVQEEVGEIDLLQLLQELKKNLRFIVISTIILATVACLFTTFFMDKKYASQARIYVSPKVNEEGYVDYSSVSSSEIMVNNYISIIKGESVLTKVSQSLGVKPSLVYGSVSVGNEEETQIIAIRSTTKDALLSKRIVEEIVNVFKEDMQEVLNIQNLLVLDAAKVSKVPVSPNIKKNTVLGALAGMMLSCGYVVVRHLLDKRLRTKEEAESFLQIPVLAEIPYYEE